MSGTTPRSAILSRVRNATAERPPEGHPGAFPGTRAEPLGTAMDALTRTFEAAGGEVVAVGNAADAATWLQDFTEDFPSVVLGVGVPGALASHRLSTVTEKAAVDTATPDKAALGVSMALGAVGETGSLILSAEDGRRTQLLPPTHVVVVKADAVHLTLAEALAALISDAAHLPSAIGLHSGPSKSADIGQILVKGVHGPGRVIALVVG